MIEYLTDEVIIGDESEIATYREAFARLRAAAVTGEDAHRLIRTP